MKPFTVWIRKPTTLMVGGVTNKPVPTIIATLTNPQIIVDEENGKITITETK